MPSTFSDDFGYWLSGLLDGEGSFQIAPNRPGFVCRVTIGLRSDDSAIIEEIRRRTGIGRLLLNRRSTGSSRRMPLSLWRVETKADCQALVVILDRYPLRSKKARDYALWREAVQVMAAMPPANGRPRDWTAVAELKRRLADVRIHPDSRQHSMEPRPEASSRAR